ncbi:MAG: hypothetical protein JJE46_07145 [Acidimicrobiia bacterium]|nr:hypothetical protein [Acidimicrobiia bacterium]
MSRRRSVALLGLVVALTACTGSGSETNDEHQPSDAPSTSATISPGLAVVDESLVTPDGRTRTYRVVVPRSVTGDTPVPLLVALHGGLGSGTQFERTSGYDDLAAEHGFIVVYPNGIEIGGPSIVAGGRVWNGGNCCGRAAQEDVDDVGFIAEVIRRLQADHRIDPRSIYATGHSNGAIMSYRLACELPDTIVAIGVQSGSIEVSGCSPHRPVSVLAIHGLADTNIPIDGGPGTGVSRTTFSSPTEAVQRFAAIDRCDSSTTRVASDNPDVTIETWPGGAAGTEVEFVRVAGATHAWMGHPSPRAGVRLSAQPYADFDSSVAIWTFLARHPRVS